MKPEKIPVRKQQAKHPLGVPGWMGTARVERTAEEPGKPSWEAKSEREAGRDNRKRPRG